MPAAAREPINVAGHLPRMASEAPDRFAVVAPIAGGWRAGGGWTSIRFAELEALSNRMANGLRSVGLVRGARVLVMVRPGVTFVALAFALFKLGAAPVMIDPGMGVRRLLDCVRSVSLDAFVGVPLAHVMRILRPGAFGGLRCVVTVGRRWAWGGHALAALARNASDAFEPVPTAADETAAILFTSGATGPAKGVVYAHGMFAAQVRQIQAFYGIEPGEVDLPAFPLFALFSTAMGMTCVIPDVDPSRPAQVDPARIVDAIRTHRVTNTFGSPAIWKRVAAYCRHQGVKLPTLRRVLIAGAPVSYQLIEALHEVLDSESDVHTPYGATEALPVASMAGRAILRDCRDLTRRGAGTCVGFPLPGIDLRIIGINDAPIDRWEGRLEVPPGTIGEIVVKGEVVTREYYGLPAATAAAKIRDGTSVWHRMGDVGFCDEQGRVWFCGRKAHRVRTPQGVMFSVCCEAILNVHPSVARCALVGVGLPGQQRAAMVVELHSAEVPRGARAAKLREELLALARANDLTRSIRDVLFHPHLPVDVRHNVKIDREALARWAAERLR